MLPAFVNTYLRWVPDMLLSPGECKSVPHHVVPEMLPNCLTCFHFSSAYDDSLPSVPFHYSRQTVQLDRDMGGVAIQSCDLIPVLKTNFTFEMILDPFKLNLNTWALYGLCLCIYEAWIVLVNRWNELLIWHLEYGWMPILYTCALMID